MQLTMRNLAPATASIPILLCMMVSHGGPALAEDATEVSPPSRSDGFEDFLVRAQRHE
jgi:hypothetical protein